MTETDRNKKEKNYTTQTVRVPNAIQEELGHRRVKTHESFQALVMRLISSELAGAEYPDTAKDLRDTQKNLDYNYETLRKQLMRLLANLTPVKNEEDQLLLDLLRDVLDLIEIRHDLRGSKNVDVQGKLQGHSDTKSTEKKQHQEKAKGRITAKDPRFAKLKRNLERHQGSEEAAG